jgi:hypothetical protein
MRRRGHITPLSAAAMRDTLTRQLPRVFTDFSAPFADKRLRVAADLLLLLTPLPPVCRRLLARYAAVDVAAALPLPLDAVEFCRA